MTINSFRGLDAAVPARIRILISAVFLGITAFGIPASAIDVQNADEQHFWEWMKKTFGVDRAAG